MKTAHEWAIVLTHERIDYGLFLREQPDILVTLKKAIFKASQELIAEVQRDATKANQGEAK